MNPSPRPWAVTEIAVRRADRRYEQANDGVRSRHCFSAGAHYEPDNVAFGPVVAVDEHLVDPGAGFDWHTHRGVLIWSWVLDGRLRHQSGSDERTIAPGELFEQDSTDGVRHRETNAGDEALRFVQTTALAGSGAQARVERGGFDTAGPAHLLVTGGEFTVDGIQVGPGDSVRLAGKASVDGDGELIVVEWGAAKRPGEE